MHATDPFEPGSTIDGRYTVLGRLGVGGMSTVLRAHDGRLDVDVAVKMLLGAPTDPSSARRAQSEVRLLTSLQHESLVTLLDAGSVDVGGRSVAYIVMDLVDGPTLSERLDEGPMSVGDVAHIGRATASALALVHARGIVHRDVKPGNILLAPSHDPEHEADAKLADFGIASVVDATRITATGTVLGSAAYVSPEQAAGQRVGTAADVYSLGLVLLEALTGEQEFQGSMVEVLSARMLRDPVVPRSLGEEWGSLLTAMTSRLPVARPTAARVALALAAVPTDVSVEEDPPLVSTHPMPVAAAAETGGRRRRRAAALVVGGAVAAGLVGLGAVVALQGQADAELAEPPAAVSQPPAEPSEAAPTEEADDATTSSSEGAEAMTADTGAVVEQAVVAPATGTVGSTSSGNGNGNGNGSGNGGGNGGGGTADPGSGSGNGSGGGSGSGSGNGSGGGSGSGSGNGSGGGSGNGSGGGSGSGSGNGSGGNAPGAGRQGDDG